MDDKAFSRFVARSILQLKYQEQKDTSDVLQALYHIRGNPNDNKYFDKKSGPITIILCEPTLNIINCFPTLEYITCFKFHCIISSI